MACKQTTIDFILKQIADAGVVFAKKMFGEYGVYCDGKIVALVCDDQLFVKPTIAGEHFLGEYLEGLPYPGAKPWFLIPSAQWNDPRWLSELIKISAAQLLPPKKKASRKKKV